MTFAKGNLSQSRGRSMPFIFRYNLYIFSTVNSLPQQPDDFGYVNNRPKVLRVTNFHNLYLYISVHITIKKIIVPLLYIPPKCLEPFNVVLST